MFVVTVPAPVSALIVSVPVSFARKSVVPAARSRFALSGSTLVVPLSCKIVPLPVTCTSPVKVLLFTPPSVTRAPPAMVSRPTLPEITPVKVVRSSLPPCSVVARCSVRSPVKSVDV